MTSEAESQEALKPEVSPWFERMSQVLERMNKRAEEDNRELEALLKEVEALGPPIPKEEIQKPAKPRRSSSLGTRAERNGRVRIEDSIALTSLTDRQRELLKLIKVENNLATYTGGEQIPDWDALKEVMKGLGGTWVRRKGFVFPDDIDAEEKVRLAVEAGEILDLKRNDLYPTPPDVVARLLKLANITLGDKVLEPSAGRGDIAIAIQETCPEVDLRCVELLPDNREILVKLGFTLFDEPDFLKIDPSKVPPFDSVVMNPPFSYHSDLLHVEHALRFLKVGGRLVSVMSAGARTARRNSVGKRFQDLVKKHKGVFESNPEGSFASSGTMIRTVILSLTKHR